MARVLIAVFVLGLALVAALVAGAARSSFASGFLIGIAAISTLLVAGYVSLFRMRGPWDANDES